MVDPAAPLSESVNAVERTLDTLAVTVDARFEAVDARFDEVTAALVEQRQYTEFAFERLRGEMVAGFSAMSTNFTRLEGKLDQLIDYVMRDSR